MNNSASASRRTWNRVMNALVWASAVLVIVLVAGILGMVLVRGIPHISWKFLTTTASVLKGTDGIHFWRDHHCNRACAGRYRLSGENEICQVLQPPGTDVHVQGGCGH